MCDVIGAADLRLTLRLPRFRLPKFLCLFWSAGFGGLGVNGCSLGSVLSVPGLVAGVVRGLAMRFVSSVSAPVFLVSTFRGCGIAGRPMRRGFGVFLSLRFRGFSD